MLKILYRYRHNSNDKILLIIIYKEIVHKNQSYSESKISKLL